MISYELTDEKRKYLKLLAEKYPSIPAVSREIINLNAILNLPKGTEHFMSDLHGEYEAFYHILNNSSGVIREKVKLTFGDILGEHERREICTLIYYPEEKLEMLKARGWATPEWYKVTLKQLIELAKVLSSKYTRSKVRKALPPEFSYIIDELLHAQPDEDNNQYVYHEKILDTIIGIDSGDEFIIALAASIKRLAVDHLHIVGDIFDRGNGADKIIELLMEYHSLDIQWGNHDILWMGAAAGSRACVAAAVRNNIKYNNMSILESGYAISLRSLTLFAEKTYSKNEPMEAALKAISIILFKLEGQIIQRHPEYEINHMLLLDKIDFENGIVYTNGTSYFLNDTDFPTVNPENPYALTSEEEKIIDELTSSFQNSERLQKHIQFLYAKGGMYRLYNGNLLFHGCIPLDENGNFDGVTIDGRIYLGKTYMDYAEKTARRAYFSHDSEALDFMWYLWCGEKSPLFGRKIKTFERMFIDDKTAWNEEKNPYFTHYKSERTCAMILREFGLFSDMSHIINGHTPIHASEGENPVKSNKKLIVIDGGFCKAYQGATGIAGYTLIYNSHGMRIKAHQPFESIEKVLTENKDIESSSDMFETERSRVMVKDTDNGKYIRDMIDDLKLLLYAYRQGIVAPQSSGIKKQ
jgi:fructose-1,6-bisphosphatase-3